MSLVLIQHSKAEQSVQSYFQMDSRVGVLQLLNERNFFEGKEVELEGFVCYGFESSAIYPTKEFAVNRLESSAIKLDLPPFRGQLNPEISPFSEYVVLRGTFRKSNRHSGPFLGSLEKIDTDFLKKAKK